MPRGDVVDRAAAVGAEHADDHQPGAPGDAGDPDAVVAAGADDAGDVRAVAVLVGRVAVAGDEVVAVDVVDEAVAVVVDPVAGDLAGFVQRFWARSGWSSCAPVSMTATVASPPVESFQALRIPMPASLVSSHWTGKAGSDGFGLRAALAPGASASSAEATRVATRPRRPGLVGFASMAIERRPSLAATHRVGPSRPGLAETARSWTFRGRPSPKPGRMYELAHVQDSPGGVRIRESAVVSAVFRHASPLHPHRTAPRRVAACLPAGALARTQQGPSGQFQPSATDRDGDGLPDGSDCAPDDPSRPARSGEDRNCDGTPDDGGSQVGVSGPVDGGPDPTHSASSESTSAPARSRARRAAGEAVVTVHLSGLGRLDRDLRAAPHPPAGPGARPRRDRQQRGHRPPDPRRTATARPGGWARARAACPGARPTWSGCRSRAARPRRAACVWPSRSSTPRANATAAGASCASRASPAARPAGPRSA